MSGHQGYLIRPFDAAYIDDAARLLAEVYLAERRASPHLPELQRLGNGRGQRVFEEALLEGARGIGVAAFHGGKLCGFMVETARFAWKGQQVAQCDELAHAARSDGRGLLSALLYQELAQRWVDDGRHLHLVGHLAHDAALKESLYRLGFGALLAEELRGLAPIAAADVEILEDPDPAALLALQREHRRYYRTSPIFLIKDDADDILAELHGHLAAGDKLLACADGDGPCALFIVGESAADAEGRLLRQTNSAQLKSAYVRPDGRGRGMGAALLQRAITWAQARGFERLFVEHETANLSGSTFWAKYFEPYLLISMRYVDNTLPG